jgi:hypothetical protein
MKRQLSLTEYYRIFVPCHYIMSTADTSRQQDAPWYAKYPEPRTDNLESIDREELLNLIKAGEKTTYILLDVRTTDHEVFQAKAVYRESSGRMFDRVVQFEDPSVFLQNHYIPLYQHFIQSSKQLEDQKSSSIIARIYCFHYEPMS